MPAQRGFVSARRIHNIAHRSPRSIWNNEAGRAHCRAILDDALQPDDQIFANLRPLNAAMGAEVIAMRSFKGTDARFVVPQKILENFPVRIAVRTV